MKNRFEFTFYSYKEKEKLTSQSRSMMVVAETFKKLPAFIEERDFKIWNFSIDNKTKTIDFLFKNGQNKIWAYR